MIIKRLIVLGLFLSFFAAGAVEAQTASTYRTSVIEGADRLMALQADSGSWDWIVTGHIAPSGTVYLNIAGVTAEGLLEAFKLTNDPKYEIAAKKAGDYIIATIDSQEIKSVNAYNLMYLKRLGDITGEDVYSDKALEYWNLLLSETPTKRCATGCVDVAGIFAGEKAGRALGYPNGVYLWDSVPFVEYALSIGDTAKATTLAELIIAETNLEAYTSSVVNYELGLASAYKVAVLTDSAHRDTLGSRIETKSSYGADAEKVQTTAYMALAFNSANDPRLKTAVDYLLSMYDSTAKGWIETDGNEYAEVDGEAIKALSLAAVDPVITLNGNSSMIVWSRTGYTELGATAVDGRGYSIDVVISGEVDSSKAGMYPVTYTATDMFGNTSEVIRNVEVKIASSVRGSSSGAASPRALEAVNAAGVTLPPAAAPVVGQVLGAFTENERDAQVATLKVKVVGLMTQLLSLLQSQLALAMQAGR